MYPLFQLDFTIENVKIHWKCKNTSCAESARKEGRGGCYPHGYDPQQLCDTFLVPPLCLSVIMSDVVYETFAHCGVIL